MQFIWSVVILIIYIGCNITTIYRYIIFDSMKENTISAQLANMQLEMSKYAIAQPFGTGDLFNEYYYSKGTADLYKTLIENDDGSLSTYEEIKAELANIENVWKTGNKLR